MTEEPRRSGRSTKGVHNKHADDTTPPPPSLSTLPPHSKPKTVRGRGKQTVEEDNNDTVEVIRCVCGSDDDEGGRMMVCCEKCEAWQHNDCMGVPEDEDKLPEKYFCEQCRPTQHKELVAAIKRGETPWEEIQRRKEEQARTKRGGKRVRSARSSDGDREQQDSPAPSQERGKRKHGDDGDDQVRLHGRAKLMQPAKVARSSSQDKAGERKVGKRSAKAEPNPFPEVVSEKISLIHNSNRKSVADFLRKKFELQSKNLATANLYKIPDGSSAAALSEHLALRVEHAMFRRFCEVSKPDFGGQYRTQMSTIASNVTSNRDLMLRLLNGKVLPEQIAGMTSDQMASEELLREMAAMKEEADQQATFTSEHDRPKIRRTHKGDEYIEDQDQGVTAFAMSAPAPRRRESEMGPESPIAADERSPKDEKAARQRSTSTFDIKSVWTNVQSPGNEERSPQVGAPLISDTRPFLKTERDEEIDRLLDDEEDDESAPYSPGDFSADASISWRGRVDMPNVGRFKAIARHIAGADLSQTTSWSNVFPETLMLSGRIHGAKADEYLSGLGAARNTDVVVHTISPAEGSGPSPQYDKLFNYFLERDRWGVVSDTVHRQYVSDNYVVPLPAGNGPMPSFLGRLQHVNIEQTRTAPTLLAVFVLKWRNGATSQTHAAAREHSTSTLPATRPSNTAMSPLTAQAGERHSFDGSSGIPHHDSPVSQKTTPGNVYQPPPQPSPTSQTYKLAELILGEHIRCPTAQSILISPEFSQGIPRPLLHNLRQIFDTQPPTRTSMEELQRVLAGQ